MQNIVDIAFSVQNSQFSISEEIINGKYVPFSKFNQYIGRWSKQTCYMNGYSVTYILQLSSFLGCTISYKQKVKSR